VKYKAPIQGTNSKSLCFQQLLARPTACTASSRRRLHPGACCSLLVSQPLQQTVNSAALSYSRS
jgi:hypothetical protein